MTEHPEKRGWVEEIEVAGEQLVEYVKKLAAEGQVQRLRIRDREGDLAVDVPLTVGAIAGGAVVIAAPVLAVIGAVAAFATKVKVEVVRDPDVAKDDTPEA